MGIWLTPAVRDAHALMTEAAISGAEVGRPPETRIATPKPLFVTRRPGAGREAA